MKHIPRKRFGQHFLTDEVIIHAIVDAIRPRPDEILVEIGPGLGALTGPLLDRIPHLDVVELDRDIITHLKKTYSSDRLTIHEADALKFDFTDVVARAERHRQPGTKGEKKRFRICGNLPYNISSPLLFHLIDHVDAIADMTFMLQKEVVDRMVAAPSTSAYGRLTVMLQRRLHLEALFDVPPEAFDPPPKVNSAIVRMIPKPVSQVPVLLDKAFERVVAAAFSQRRKTLRNTLAGTINAEELIKLGIDPGLRAQNLSVSQYELITRHVTRPVGSP
ncbi:MAG: 16S rRNA (adenine(1518)-N(6)/adenine(1519)-N(6))-dimethyltransferase RsmA [Thiobacillaceae bacterium]